jgi:hypothetical protein
MKELKKRGKGKKESGAFLLGPQSGDREITEFICYNDLDLTAFESGIIIFNGDGYIPLWKKCIKEGLKVWADVHTHPTDWTGQSASDMANPMVAQKGHIALIVPDFARRRRQLLDGVGIHEFLGERKWKAWDGSAGVINLIK